MSDSDPSDPSGRLRGLFGFRRKPAPQPETGAPETVPGSAPQVMRLRVAEFEQLRVYDVMVPRAEIQAVEAGTGFPDLLRFFAEVTHSRLPVFRDTLDDPIGFVHIKDVVSELAKDETLPKRPGLSLSMMLDCKATFRLLPASVRVGLTIYSSMSSCRCSRGCI